MSNKLGKEQTTSKTCSSTFTSGRLTMNEETCCHFTKAKMTLVFFVRRAEVAVFMTFNVQEEQIPCGVFS